MLPGIMPGAKVFSCHECRHEDRTYSDISEISGCVRRYRQNTRNLLLMFFYTSLYLMESLLCSCSATEDLQILSLLQVVFSWVIIWCGESFTKTPYKYNMQSPKGGLLWVWNSYKLYQWFRNICFQKNLFCILLLINDIFKFIPTFQDLIFQTFIKKKLLAFLKTSSIDPSKTESAV